LTKTVIFHQVDLIERTRITRPWQAESLLWLRTRKWISGIRDCRDGDTRATGVESIRAAVRKILKNPAQNHEAYIARAREVDIAHSSEVLKNAVAKDKNSKLH
jgi:hypothetical protein